MACLTIENTIGNTPLVQLQRVPGEDNARRGNVTFDKLEDSNPAGSVRDRPALSMAERAEARGRIKPGDTPTEATSGSTGIALAMAAAVRGYKMVFIMPENLSMERRQSITTYGAEIILTLIKDGMEYARDLADAMEEESKGVILDQFANPNSPLMHYETTGPELQRSAEGRITHFISAMDTTDTITGVSCLLKEKNADIQIIGAQPEEGSRIPGIWRWPRTYVPKIYNPKYTDRTEPVSQSDVEHMARRMTREEGIFYGISAAGVLYVALRVTEGVENATIVFMVCGRDDRYLSTDVSPA